MRKLHGKLFRRNPSPSSTYINHDTPLLLNSSSPIVDTQLVLQPDMVLSNLSLLASLAACAVATSGSSALQNILDNAHRDEKYSYPTQFTRDIIPKAFHSHNDYWRDVPYYSALSYGAMSVEADVWLVNGTLYVGHEQSALTTSRTLTSLYIDPILDTLKRQNPITEFTPEPTTHGVYDASSGQTLYLFIDLKTDGPETWPVVLEALKPLLSANYLTTYDGNEITERPVTVIGTGNTPRALVQGDNASPSSPRYAYFDASLAQLSTAQSNITRFDSPIASTSFERTVGETKDGSLNDTQLEVLRGQISAAHEKGIMARYWELPGWPVGSRNRIWRTLWDEGVDLLNVDDLKGVSEFWENEF